MILDTQEQKTILLQIMDAINVPGKDLEIIYNLKQAIKFAETKTE